MVVKQLSWPAGYFALPVAGGSEHDAMQRWYMAR